MNSSQRSDKANNEHMKKIGKDILKISLAIVALKIATAVINKQ
jgi:hypothetical protein